MFRPSILLLCILASCLPLSADLVPARTYAFIVGVLHWQDTSLATYAPEGRQDKALQQMLLQRGVPESQMRLLLDNQATLTRITAELTELAQTAEKDSTLIFYYAGHGLRHKAQVFFANYDIDTNRAESTGLSPEKIGTVIKQQFKGKTVLLLADCCYSGSLQQTAALLCRADFQAAAVTSAAASNASTGNWTYSQTLIRVLSGDYLADHNGDRCINLEELGQEVAAAMRFREHQKSGYVVCGIPPAFSLNRVEEIPPGSSKQGPYHIGDYLSAHRDGWWQTARIIRFTNEKAMCEFLAYSSRTLAPVDLDQLQPIRFTTYPAGTSVEILWGNAYYPGKILKVDNGFHLVTYDNYEDYWNEWVISDRLRLPADPAEIQVEWEGQWYPAVILEESEGEYFIHYIGYENDWDEWVTAERIRF